MNIVAIGAHPDDVELCGGGTLLRWALEESHRVTVVVVSDGSRGGSADAAEVERLVKTRAAEGAGAAKFMGADFAGLGLPDGLLEDNHETRMGLAEVFRRARADLVIGPPPDDYNPDHVAVALAVESACLWSCVPAFPSESPALPEAPALWFFDSVGGLGEQPQVFVDITEVFDKKVELLGLHRSQESLATRVLGTDLVDVATRTNSFRGLQAGVAYAEGFRRAGSWPRVRDSSWHPWPGRVASSEERKQR